MPPLPPVELILDVVSYTLLVPFTVAMVVGFVVARSTPAGTRLAGGLIAVTAGFLAANHFRQVVEFHFDADRPWSWAEFGRYAGLALTGTKVPGSPPARYWWNWAVLAVAIPGILLQLRKVPGAVVWSVRLVAVGVAALLLVPSALRSEVPWLCPALAVVLLANWQILEAVGRDAQPLWLPTTSAALFLAGSAVFIHAHTARFTDLATILAGCWLATAVVAYWQKVEFGGAIPITAIGLPGLALITQQSTYSEVPVAAFGLIAVSPLALVPLISIPAPRRKKWGYAVLSWLLVAIPAGLAVGLAIRHETLSFE